MTRLERILAYDRIDANRRATRILLVVFALAATPVAAYVALYLTEIAALFVGIGWVASGASEPASEGSWTAFVALMASIALALTGLLTFLQYCFAARAILRVARAKAVGADEEPELHRQVENLCIAAGIPKPRLWVMEAPAANAFSTGMTPESASLVVTRGLLSLLDRQELEGVLSHELSQIGNGDTRIGTVLAAGVAFMRMPFVIVAAISRAAFRLHWIVGTGLLLYLGVPIVASIPGSVAFGVQMLEENMLEGIIFLSAGTVTLYIFAVAPALSHVVRVAVTRQRALLADAEAVLLTRNAEGLARALAKMEAAGTFGMRVGAATAHLYVTDPLGENAPWWDRWLPSHPPVTERIDLLGAMGSGFTPSTLDEAREAGEAFRWRQSPSLATPVFGDGSETEREGEMPLTPPAPVAYRLGASETIVHQEADAASPEVERLPAGSLVAVQEPSGDFLYVITPKDNFGYIAGTAPMTPVKMPL